MALLPVACPSKPFQRFAILHHCGCSVGHLAYRCFC
jgi:hypothetical protein